MNEGLIVLATFLGALGSGTAGWWDSHEPFDGRKFMGSVWRAIFAAMLSTMTFQIGSFTGWQIYFAAFLAGAGVDSFGNRIQGAMGPRTDRLSQVEETIKKLVQERVPPSTPEVK